MFLEELLVSSFNSPTYTLLTLAHTNCQHKVLKDWHTKQIWSLTKFNFQFWTTYHVHMHGIPVSLAINSHRLYTHSFGCSHHPAGNFSSVGNEDLGNVSPCLKHHENHTKMLLGATNEIVKVFYDINQLINICFGKVSITEPKITIAIKTVHYFSLKFKISLLT